MQSAHKCKRPQQRAFLHYYKNEIMKCEKGHHQCQIPEAPLRSALITFFVLGVPRLYTANGTEKHFPLQEEKVNSFLD